jgi:hypothetical protein
MNTTEANYNLGQGTEGRNGAANRWASLESMEGIGINTGEWYDFPYRDYVLPIGTESDGRGGKRFVFNHPTTRDLANNRPKRVRRDSRPMIEMEARKVIDEILDNQVRLSREEFQQIHVQLNLLRRLEQAVAPLALSPESFLDQLVASLQRLRLGVTSKALVEIWTEQLAQASTGATTAVPTTDPALPAKADARVSEKQRAKPLDNSVPETEPNALADDGPSSATTTPAIINENPKPQTLQLAPVPSRLESVSEKPKRRRSSPRFDIRWPAKPEFLEWLWTKRGTQIGRELGCDGTTVLAKADELGLERPKPDYWSTKRYGDAVEIPDSIKDMILQLRKAAQESIPEISPQCIETNPADLAPRSNT